MQEIDIIETAMRHFKPLEGKSVEVVANPNPVSVVVKSVSYSRFSDKELVNGVRPFSIILTSPSNIHLVSGTYPILFPGIGLIQLYLEPVITLTPNTQDYQILIC